MDSIRLRRVVKVSRCVRKVEIIRVFKPTQWFQETTSRWPAHLGSIFLHLVATAFQFLPLIASWLQWLSQVFFFFFFEISQWRFTSKFQLPARHSYANRMDSSEIRQTVRSSGDASTMSRIHLTALEVTRINFIGLLHMFRPFFFFKCTNNIMKELSENYHHKIFTSDLKSSFRFIRLWESN